MDNFNLDFSGLNRMVSSTAMQFQRQQDEINRAIEEGHRHQAKKDAALFEMSESSVAQKHLLEKQLIEVKEQNKLLKTNYDTLNELYQLTKKQAEDSEKEAKKNRTTAYVSIGIAIASIVVAVVFGII